MASTHLGNAETSHLVCRTYGHAWTPTVTFVTMKDRKRAYEVNLMCRRCKTHREDVVGRRDGALVARRYDYADGYLMSPNGDRKAFRREIRIETMQRLTKR